MLTLLLLVAVALSGGGGTSSSDAGLLETDPAVRSLSSVMDSQLAEQSQRKHLEALFNR